MGTSGNNASGGQQDPFWQELHGGNRGQEYRQQSDGQQTYGQPNYDQQDIFHRTEQEMYQRRQGEKEKKPNRPLVISLIILVIIGIVLFIISVVLVAGQDVAGQRRARCSGGGDHRAPGGFGRVSSSGGGFGIDDRCGDGGTDCRARRLPEIFPREQS